MMVVAVTHRAGLLSVAAILRMSHQVGEALVPVMIGYVVDRAIGPSSARELVLGLAGLGAVFAVLSWSYRLGSRAGVRVAAEAGHEIRMRLMARVLDPYGAARAGRAHGELLSISTSDADKVAGANGLVIYCAASLAALSTAATALFLVSWKLGVLVLVGTPVLLALVSVLSGPLGRRTSAEQAGVGRASAVAADLVAGLRVVKGISAETAASARYRQASRTSLTATLRAAYAEAGLEAATTTLSALFLAAVAWVGGLLALRGEISIGGFIAAFGLAQFVATPMSQLAAAGARWAQAGASARRVAAVLVEPSGLRAQGRDPVSARPGSLELQDVVVTGLGPLSLRIEAGLVGVVVDQAGHAQLLAECLGRQIDPEGGRLLIDGRAYGDLDVDALRRAVVYAGHDARLFGRSVDEVMARSGDDPAWVRRVLAATRADEVVSTLRHGSAGLIGPDGANLSGGQRQRLLLAQSLVSDPPVLVLHDPTTAVDPVTEDEIGEGLVALRRGRTTALLTTSPILLSRCDRVLFVHGGRLAAEGSHGDLVAGNDRYRRLVQP